MSDFATEGLGVDFESLRLRGQDDYHQRSQDFQTIAHSSAESEHVPACEFDREMAVDAAGAAAKPIVLATVVAAVVAIVSAISVFAVVALAVATVALALDSLLETLYNRALLRSRRDISCRKVRWLHQKLHQRSTGVHHRRS